MALFNFLKSQKFLSLDLSKLHKTCSIQHEFVALEEFALLTLIIFKLLRDFNYWSNTAKL